MAHLLHHRHHKRQLSNLLNEAKSVANSIQDGGDSSEAFTPTTVVPSTVYASTVFQTVSGDFTQPTVAFSTFSDSPDPTPVKSQQSQTTQAQSSPQQQSSSSKQQPSTFTQQTSQTAQISPSSTKQQSSQQSSPQSTQPQFSSTNTQTVQVLPNSSSSSSSASLSSYVAPSSMSSSQTGIASALATAAATTLASSAASVAAPTGESTSHTSAAAAAAASTSSHDSQPAKHGGMSGGAKAGLAFGIIAIIGLIAGGIYFFYTKKKRQNEDFERAENEKFNAAGTKPRDLALSESEKSPANAPRVSLRPVTQFLPDLNAAKKRLSNVNLAGTKQNIPGAAGSPRNLSRPTPGSSAWERRAVPVSGSDNDPNPFSDPINPFSDKNASAPGTPTISITPPATSDGTDAPVGALAGAAVAGAAVGAVAKNSDKASSGPSREVAGNGPPSSSSSSAGSAASTQGEDNVHRIQMDFAPSMDDELELRAGQLIKVLHEYDDGWNGPRPGSARGPMTPPGSGPISTDPRTRSPTSPPPQGPLPQPRPMSPAPYNQPPRPLSPGLQKPRSPAPQKRSMSPGPYGGGPGGVKPPPAVGQRRRSNSTGAVSVRDKRNSPPGPSPLAKGQSSQPLPPPGTAS
ncbi:MAG: hypothetical protein Q9160_006248 [Pyrenula sp. 1 TL-2023]